MSDHYTIRRLKWITEGDRYWLAKAGKDRRYYIRPMPGGLFVISTYLRTDSVSDELGRYCPTLTAAKAACRADWVKRLEPALVPVRGKKNK